MIERERGEGKRESLKGERVIKRQNDKKKNQNNVRNQFIDPKPTPKSSK